MIRPPAFCLPFCLCLPAAGGQSLPVRKPGLREVAVRAEGDSLVRQQKVQQCTDAGTDAVLLMAVVPGQADCHESSIREREGRYDVRTVCYVHDNRVEAHVQLSGSFSTAYEGRFDVKYARPVRPTTLDPPASRDAGSVHVPPACGPATWSCRTA